MQMNGMMEAQYNQAMTEQQHMMMMQRMEWNRAQEEAKVQQWRMQQ